MGKPGLDLKISVICNFLLWFFCDQRIGNSLSKMFVCVTNTKKH